MGPKHRGGRPRKTNGKMKEVALQKESESLTRQQIARNKKNIVQATHFRLTTLPSGRRGEQRKHNETVLEDDATITSDPHVTIGSSSDGGIAGDGEPVEIDVRAKSKHKLTADRTREWLSFRSPYLDEITRLDGLASDLDRGPCARCGQRTTNESMDDRVGKFRCEDCIDRSLLCRKCMVRSHQHLPIHRISEWTGKYMQKTTLRDIGLQISLGHNGDLCPTPSGQKKKLVVCHTSGFHHVHVIFCGCLSPGAGFVHQWKQLMRIKWYPATRTRPNTVFTFEVLDFYLELSHQGKLNLYDFHKTLDRITDNSGTVATWHCYRQLSDAMRQWRHLMMLKRSGRGHNPLGISSTLEGDCAVECAACPHPDRNLPEDWQNAPPHVAWLYVLFLMLDANFKLRLKARGIEDIELSPGWSYFVREAPYVSFTGQFGAEIERNTCLSDHNAIARADVAEAGYLVRGTAACLCNRHHLVRKNGVANLQRGEKYCSMDYILLATLISTTAALFVTYDIACQYMKNFPKRNDNFPPCLKLAPERALAIRWAIPKMHYEGHQGGNHEPLCLNYVRHVGRSYGEGIESNWGSLNPMAPSTKEMAPSYRREVLDSHWGSWNWQKTRAFGATFARNLREAFIMRDKHQEHLEQFSSTFPPEVIARWEGEVVRWEADPSSKPNPFAEEVTAVTLQQVKLKLALEDSADAARGVRAPHEITRSKFIELGLEIEDKQRALARRAKKRHSTSELASTQQKRNALAHRIATWRRVQEIYMPYVADLIAAGNADLRDDALPPDPLDDEDAVRSAGTKAEHVQLLLPSSLPARLREGDSTRQLLRIELELRSAQADDSLAEIRRFRRVLVSIATFKNLNVSGTGQKANTRIRGVYDKFQKKIDFAVARYRCAFQALTHLDPNGGWRMRFRQLLDRDVRGPGREDDRMLGEGLQETSWIWRTGRVLRTEMDNGNGGRGDNGSGDGGGDGDDDAQYGKSMQVEWSKSRARAHRWAEEVVLLQEEMRRVLQYFAWKARWWRARADARTVSNDLRSGLAAYAEKQACIFETLAFKFASQWVPVLRLNDITPDWAVDYNVDPSTKPLPPRHRPSTSTRPGQSNSGTGSDVESSVTSSSGSEPDVSDSETEDDD